jgi:hypothetical protein
MALGPGRSMLCHDKVPDLAEGWSRRHCAVTLICRTAS